MGDMQGDTEVLLIIAIDSHPYEPMCAEGSTLGLFVTVRSPGTGGQRAVTLALIPQHRFLSVLNKRPRIRKAGSLYSDGWAVQGLETGAEGVAWHHGKHMKGIYGFYWVDIKY